MYFTKIHPLCIKQKEFDVKVIEKKGQLWEGFEKGSHILGTQEITDVWGASSSSVFQKVWDYLPWPMGCVAQVQHLSQPHLCCHQPLFDPNLQNEINCLILFLKP